MKQIYSTLKNKIAATLGLVLFATGAFAQTNVLVCGAALPQSWLDDVQNKLIATGSFTSVTTFNTTSGTPTLAYLQTFNAVMVFTDYSPQDPTTLGNNIASYIDGGGGVVNCVFSNASIPLGGNFNTTPYQVVVPLSQTEGTELTLGATLVSCDPIMQGITSFDGGTSTYRSTSTTLAPGAQFVADYNDGEWLVADRINVGPSNARRADLNFYPPSSDVRADFWVSSTQGGQLMANALLWVAGVLNSSSPPTSPASVTGNTGICVGSTATYTCASVVGATSYTWSVPAGTTINSGQGTTSISITAGSTSGNISVTADNGCGSSAPTIFVLTINPLPTVGSTASPTSVCPGGSVTVNGTGATTYAWSGGVTNNVPFVPISTTTYTVTGTDANGCSNTATQLVTVNPLPNVTANSTAAAVCTGNSVTLTGGGATSYTWTNSVTNGVSFVPVSTATYTVTGTDANGCTNTASTTVTVNPLPNVTANASSAAVCTGNSVTLTGGGATSYTWSGGVTNAVAFVPLSTLTYTVTGTDANGCSNTANTTVTVNPLPTVTANSSAAAVCNGSSVTLTGGGATSYTWTNSVTNAVAFTPASTATYTVTGTDANGCMNTATTTVIVNPLPTVTANATASTVCSGSPVTLTGGGATSYSWTNSVTNGVPFNPIATATYTVTGTDANGCTNTATVSVAVSPGPNVTATSTPNVSCAGDSVTLTGSGAVSYTWTGGVMNGVPFVPTSTMTYTVTGTDASGCTNTATVTVGVNQLPTVTANASSLIACLNDGLITLSGTPAGGAWSGPAIVGNTFNPTVATTGVHALFYTYTDPNGCTNSAFVNITVNACTGVEGSSLANGVNVYPNPNSGEFTVSINANVGDVKMEILDMQGRVVYASAENNVQIGFTKQISMNEMPNGIYMLRLTSNDGRRIIKISVMK